MTPTYQRFRLPLLSGGLSPLCALVLAGGLAALPAQAEDLLDSHVSLDHRYAELDIDGDGLLQVDELGRGYLRTLDTNRDGEVSRAELEGALRRDGDAERIIQNTRLGITTLALSDDEIERANAHGAMLRSGGHRLHSADGAGEGHGDHAGHGATGPGDTRDAASLRQAPKRLVPQHHKVGAMVPDLSFADVDGRDWTLSQLVGERPLVIGFTDTACPVAKRYGGTWGELAADLDEQGVGLLLVNVNRASSGEDIAAFRAAHGLEDVPYVHDRSQAFAHALDAATTTESFVLDAARTMIYRGAVNDQYGLGYTRPSAAQRYLRAAVDAVLAGDRPEIQATTAPGCFLDLRASADIEVPATPVAYYGGVDRILQQNCVACHREGGIAPFSLESYEMAEAMSGMIDYVIDNRIMPPFYAAPEPRNSPWANDLSLSEEDRALLLAWARSDDLPQGDPADAGIMRAFDDEWTYGEPDLVVAMPEAAPVPATGQIPYFNVRMPTGLAEDKWIKGVEFKPGAREVVHHVLVFLIPEDKKNMRLDDPSGSRTGLFAIYGPGTDKVWYPDGIARKLPAGSWLHFQVHYTTNGIAVEDQTSLALYFADYEPQYELRTAGGINTGIRIPAGAPRHEETALHHIPADIQLLSVVPHMHYTGTAAEMVLVNPDGSQRALLNVPRFDFNWQTIYQFHEPVPVEAGSTILSRFWYDNSRDNPAAVHYDADIRWGEQSDEEMLIGYIEYLLPNAPPARQAMAR